MVMNFTKISQKMKKINWLSIEQNIIEWKKALYYKGSFTYYVITFLAILDSLLPPLISHNNW